MFPTLFTSATAASLVMSSPLQQNPNMYCSFGDRKLWFTVTTTAIYRVYDYPLYNE